MEHAEEELRASVARIAADRLPQEHERLGRARPVGPERVPEGGVPGVHGRLAHR